MGASPAMDIRFVLCVGLLVAIGSNKLLAQPPTRPRVAPWEKRWQPLMLREEYLFYHEVIIRIPDDVIFLVPVGHARSIRPKYAPHSAQVDNLGVAWIRWKSPREISLNGIIPGHTQLTVVYPSAHPLELIETINYPVCVYAFDRLDDWPREFRVTQEP